MLIIPAMLIFQKKKKKEFLLTFTLKKEFLFFWAILKYSVKLGINIILVQKLEKYIYNSKLITKYLHEITILSF